MKRIEVRNKVSKTLSDGRISGENNPSWKGGLEKRKRDNTRVNSAYVGWSQLVRKRDKNTCAFNNLYCNKNKIAHHILPWRDYPNERYNIDNGIILCENHHPRKRNEEKLFIPLLQGIVAIKKRQAKMWK